MALLVHRIAELFEIFQMFDCHLDYFCLLDSAAPLFHVMCRNKFAQIGEAVIHTISAPLLNNPVRCWVLLFHFGFACARSCDR